MTHNLIEDNATALFERKSLIWGAFLAGLSLGFVAVYIVIAQPMFGELRDLQRQTSRMHEDIHQLVGVRGQAWEAGTLLSDLSSLKAQIVDARATLREIKQLRHDLIEESRHTAGAAAALHEFARLQDTALERQELTAPAAQAVEQMAILHQRLTDSTEEVTSAKAAAGELLSLKDQLISSGSEIEGAQVYANRLLALQDQLTAHSQDSAVAFEHVEKLFDIHDRLVDETPRVAGAVQNLELLSDFQDEFAAQIESLSRMRENLTQFLFMETTISRLAQALEPLTQIVNIRRLSDQELREAARSILDNRATRLSSRPNTPMELPRTAENDLLPPPSDEARYFDIPTDLGASSEPASPSVPEVEAEESALTN